MNFVLFFSFILTPIGSSPETAEQARLLLPPGSHGKAPKKFILQLKGPDNDASFIFTQDSEGTYLVNQTGGEGNDWWTSKVILSSKYERLNLKDSFTNIASSKTRIGLPDLYERFFETSKNVESVGKDDRHWAEGLPVPTLAFTQVGFIVLFGTRYITGVEAIYASIGMLLLLPFSTSILFNQVGIKIGGTTQLHRRISLLGKYYGVRPSLTYFSYYATAGVCGGLLGVLAGKLAQ